MAQDTWAVFRSLSYLSHAAEAQETERRRQLEEAIRSEIEGIADQRTPTVSHCAITSRQFEINNCAASFRILLAAQSLARG